MKMKLPTERISTPTYEILDSLFSRKELQNFQGLFRKHFKRAEEARIPVEEARMKVHIWRCVEGSRVNDVSFETPRFGSQRKTLEMKGTNSTGKTTAALIISTFLGLDLKAMRERFLKQANIDRIDELIDSGYLDLNLELNDEKFVISRGSDGDCTSDNIVLYDFPGRTPSELEVNVLGGSRRLNDTERQQRRVGVSKRIRDTCVDFFDVDYIDSERDIGTNVSVLLMETMEDDLERMMSLIADIEEDIHNNVAKLENIIGKYHSVESYHKQMKELEETLEDLTKQVETKKKSLEDSETSAEARSETFMRLLSELNGHGFPASECELIGTRLKKWREISNSLDKLKSEVITGIDILKSSFQEFGRTGSSEDLQNVMTRYSNLRKSTREYLKSLEDVLKVEGEIPDASQVSGGEWMDLMSSHRDELDEMLTEVPDTPLELRQMLLQEIEYVKEQTGKIKKTLDEVEGEVVEIEEEMEHKMDERGKLIRVMEREGNPYDDEDQRSEVEARLEDLTQERENLRRVLEVLGGLANTAKVIPHLHKERFWQYADPEGFFERKMNNPDTSVELIDFLNSLDFNLFPIYAEAINEMARKLVPQMPMFDPEGMTRLVNIESIDVFMEEISYVVDDVVKKIHFHDLGKGQKSVVTVIMSAMKPCRGRYGRILFVDEIGDLDTSEGGFYDSLCRIIQDMPNILSVFFIFPSEEREVTVT